jgi:cytochrome c oxidase accessory protein FixG
MSIRWAAASSTESGNAMATAELSEKERNDDPFADHDEPLYQARRRIYPLGVSGYFRNLKWFLLIVTLGIYYLLPFVRWDRGPDAPSQAVLVDFPARRFYFFFIELWPQEVYYFTGLLVLAALGLFLMNAVAGRVWCGYLCPQTVWTDLFMLVERKIEGDRRERMRADAEPWSFAKARRKAAKHFIWIVIAWWTGGAWVLYFADAPTLVWQLATFQAPAIAWISIGILTFTTYSLAGLMREQVCTYLCPWPRIQAGLIDEHSLNVTYRFDRGEPRESLKKSEAARARGVPTGDCIDCNQCVAVCPTGVDIRHGLQLACIQCGLCIDACDSVMNKTGRPTGLIGYDTDLNIQRRMEGKPEIRKIVRPRTILYAVLIAVVATIMMTALVLREEVGVHVIHDRNPIFVRLSDGSIRNGFTVRLLNKERDSRAFAIEVDGLLDAAVEVVGAKLQGSGNAIVDVGPDQTHEIRLLVTMRNAPPQSSTPIVVRITDISSGHTAEARDFFRSPEPEGSVR